jgi:hypothetical protein
MGLALIKKAAGQKCRAALSSLPSTPILIPAIPASEFGYTHGDVFGSSGHLRVTVTPAQVTVEYVRSYLVKDERPGQINGQVDFRYIISPR